MSTPQSGQLSILSMVYLGLILLQHYHCPRSSNKYLVPLLLCHDTLPLFKSFYNVSSMKKVYYELFTIKDASRRR